MRIRGTDVPETKGRQEKREPGILRFWFPTLRDGLEDLNYVPLTISIDIHRCRHKLQGICMHTDRLPAELGLSEQDVERIREAGLDAHPRRYEAPRHGSLTWQFSDSPTNAE